MATPPPPSSEPTASEAPPSPSLPSGPEGDDPWNATSSDADTSRHAATSAKDYQRRGSFIHSRPASSALTRSATVAIERAERYGLSQLVPRETYGPERGWRVRSATRPDITYLVTIRDETIRKGDWWNILSCECFAEQRNLRVCWHKALVVLSWRRSKAKGTNAHEYRD